MPQIVADTPSTDGGDQGLGPFVALVGVIGFTTNRLAELADIPIRTIYHYFPSKLGILSALMIHLYDDSADGFNQFSELGDPNRDWRKLINGWIDNWMEWTRDRPGARLLMGWSHSIPELMQLQNRIDMEWTYGMVKAIHARGVDLPEEQLYAVCRCFNETLDSLTLFAVSDVHECSPEMIDEIRNILIRYLEVYLD